MRTVDPVVDAIRRIREVRGWSQAELARQAGIGRSTISTAEAGDSAYNLVTARMLTSSLDVDLAALLISASRVDAAVACLTHTQDVRGSNPLPATVRTRPHSTAITPAPHWDHPDAVSARTVAG